MFIPSFIKLKLDSIQVPVNSRTNQPSCFYPLMKHLTTQTMNQMQVFIKNFGCSANTADSEVYAGCLAKAGYIIAKEESFADILIYNTCAVKGPTENKIIQALKHAPKDKKLIVTGCLPKISFDRLLREVRFDGVVGASVGQDIVEVVERVLAGEHVLDLEAIKDKPKLDLPRISVNPLVSVVPVNYGCLGSCAYCCVVLARGRLKSYSIDEVVSRVQFDYAAGSREFWVTSQDTASYGRDLGTNLVELLNALGKVNGNFKVRVGMMTPNLVSDIQSELLESYKNEKIFKFLHLPVQSGDDEVLELMHRFYSAKEFKAIVEAFRQCFDGLTLATDVIVGFPGETSQAFENTLKLLRDVKPDVINISKFFARPKTAAAQMREGLVDLAEIKQRSIITSALAKQLSLERNRQWIGWVGEVLVDEKGKVEDSWVGRNFAYKPIAIKNKDNLLGKILKVKVVDAYATYLSGSLE